MGNKAFRKVIIRPEGSKGGSTFGGTILWHGVGNLKDDRETKNVEMHVGVAMPILRPYTPRLGGTLTLASTPATYQQLVYILDAGMNAASPTGVVDDGVGATGILHRFNMPLTTAPDIRTYKVYSGDNTQAESMNYCFVESFSLKANSSDALMMEATWKGRSVEHDTFPAATLVMAETILGKKGSFFIDDTGDDVGGTQITGSLLEWGLTVNTGWKAKFTVDDGQLYFNYAYYDAGSAKAELTLKYEHDSFGVAERTAKRNNEIKQIRLLVEGSDLETAGTNYSKHTLQIDCAGYYSAFSEIGDMEGNSTVDATLQIGYSIEDGYALVIDLVNEVLRTSSFA